MVDLREGLRHTAGHLSELRSVFGSYKHIDRLTDARSFNSAVEGVPSAAIDEIRRLQPARLGTDFRLDPLWQLNELSNIAKHRTSNSPKSTLSRS